jgi:hypothetical protein
MKIERRLEILLAAGMAAFGAAPTSANGNATPVAVGNCGVQATKPTDLTIACGDGNDYLKSMKWTVWSDTVARGSGVEGVNDCNPYCAAGKFHSYRVTVTLDQVQSNRFTRLRIHYPAARPPNRSQNVARILP